MLPGYCWIVVRHESSMTDEILGAPKNGTTLVSQAEEKKIYDMNQSSIHSGISEIYRNIHYGLECRLALAYTMCDNLFSSFKAQPQNAVAPVLFSSR